jgi:hypothetical protein
MDFDEFNYLDRKRSPLDWRDPLPICASDCKVIINGGAKEYSIHLEVACRSSKFFFKVAAGISQPAENTPPLVPPASDGDVQLKMQDGTTARIGRVTGTLMELKEQVNKTLGISGHRQRLFYRKAQGADVELDEDWRTMTSYGVKRGDTVMLVVREPWQRTETADSGKCQTKTLHFALPEVCVGVFETVLDYMYRFHRDPRAEHTLPDLSAESALGALWLAGRLEMPELQEQVVEHLQGKVTEQSAHAYLPAAVRLGLVKVREAAMRLAAAGLGGMTAGACDGLPLEAMEQLLGMAEESGVGAEARDRVLALFLRAYDGGERLDEEAYRRLMRRHSASSARSDADGRAEGGEGADAADGEGVGAEDALLLLDMALRCAHRARTPRRVPRRALRRAGEGEGG